MDKPLSRTAIKFRLRRAFIYLPHVASAMDRIQQLIVEDWSGVEPEHLMILGMPGTGKSTFLEHVTQRHTKTVHETFTEIPVLYADIPTKCSIHKLVTTMLHSMGSPLWDKGDEGAKTIHLKTLLRACKTRLVILDEVNHLVDRGQGASHYTVGDWIKGLAEKSRVSVVLSGIPRSRTLLHTNEQLADRFGEILEFPTLSLDETSRATTMAALKEFGKLLGMDSIDLANPKTAQKIIYATQGRLRPLRRLLVRAVDVGFTCETPRVDLPVLRTAFEQVIYKGSPPERNPFCEDFNGKPLTKPGEPYEPTKQRPAA